MKTINIYLIIDYGYDRIELIYINNKASLLNFRLIIRAEEEIKLKRIENKLIIEGKNFIKEIPIVY